MFLCFCTTSCVQPSIGEWFLRRRWTEKLKETYLEISKRYEMAFIEIGTDQDHVHFLVQSVPMYSPRKSCR